MSKAQTFEERKAELEAIYKDSGIAGFIDYLKDNPEFREAPDGEPERELTLSASRSFKAAKDGDQTVPQIKINLETLLKLNGEEQTAQMAIDLDGKATFVVLSTGFGADFNKTFKQIRAVRTRVDQWMKSIEKASGFDDLISGINKKSDTSLAGVERKPGESRYEGERRPTR